MWFCYKLTIPVGTVSTTTEGTNSHHDKFTCSILDMSQGRAPLCASSTIFCLVESGRGLPFTNTPPSWFTPLWPTHTHTYRNPHTHTLARTETHTEKVKWSFSAAGSLSYIHSAMILENASIQSWAVKNREVEPQWTEEPHWSGTCKKRGGTATRNTGQKKWREKKLSEASFKPKTYVASHGFFLIWIEIYGTSLIQRRWDAV